MLSKVKIPSAVASVLYLWGKIDRTHRQCRSSVGLIFPRESGQERSV